MTGEILVGGVCLGFVLGALMAGVLRGCAAYFTGMGRGFWRAANWAAPGVVAGMAVVALAQAAASHAAGYDKANRQVGGIALLIAAAILTGSAWRVRRTPPAQVPPRSLSSPSGALGLLLILLMAGGGIAHEAGFPAGAPIGLAGLALYVVLIVVHLVRGQRSFDSVRARVTSARHWPLPDRKPDTGDGGINPYEADRVTGRWGSAKIWVALVHGGASVKVALDRWPAGLAALPGARGDVPSTGDPDFDRAVGLAGDPAAWRPALTAEVRGHLVELVGRREGLLDAAARTLELHLPESEAGALSALLDRMAALAGALPAAGGAAGLAARVADEPVAAVRRGHYEWLLAQAEGGPLVLRAAADDPDPEIAAWAKSQLPPDGGAYR